MNRVAARHAAGGPLRDWLELVRAPAALSVLGDTLAGAAAARRPLTGRRLALPVASVAFYWSGMALNDWADRALDAAERPERPIPSGRIRPGHALAAAAGLSASGLALAGLAGGRPALRTAVPLAGSIWAYNTLLKPTRAAPAAMAACRALDVLLGAGAGGWTSARTPALAIALHTFGITALSRGEVHADNPRDARTALAATGLCTALTITGRAASPRHRALAAVCGAGYAGLVGAAQWSAGQELTRSADGSGGSGAGAGAAAAVRAATETGIRGLVLLQSALAAGSGSACSAGLVLLLPAAHRLSKRLSST